MPLICLWTLQRSSIDKSGETAKTCFAPVFSTGRHQAFYNAASRMLPVPEGCFIVFGGASIGFASHKTTALKAGNCRCSISRFTT